MGFAAVQVLSGATKLSELAVDVSKNWLANLIKNMGDPVDAQDAATRAYVLAQLASEASTRAANDTAESAARAAADALRLLLAGGTMSGAIAMGTSKITGMGDPDNDQDAATKKYVDDQIVSSALFGNVTDVTASRAWNTIYKNTNAFPIMVVVTINHFMQALVSKGFLSGSSIVEVYCEGATPPTIMVADSGTYFINIAPGSSGGSHMQMITYDTLTFVVPTNYYYKLAAGFAEDAIDEGVVGWLEYGGIGSIP